jgi:hypothetical protein
MVLDGAHGVVDSLPQVGSLGQREKVGESCRLGEVDDALCVVVRWTDSAPRRSFRLDGCAGGLELRVGEAKKDEPENGRAVLRRLQAGVGPQLVCRIPESPLQLGEVRRHRDLSGRPFGPEPTFV